MFLNCSPVFSPSFFLFVSLAYFLFFEGPSIFPLYNVPMWGIECKKCKFLVTFLAVVHISCNVNPISECICVIFVLLLSVMSLVYNSIFLTDVTFRLSVFDYFLLSWMLCTWTIQYSSPSNMLLVY